MGEVSEDSEMEAAKQLPQNLLKLTQQRPLLVQQASYQRFS